MGTQNENKTLQDSDEKSFASDAPSDEEESRETYSSSSDDEGSDCDNEKRDGKFNLFAYFTAEYQRLGIDSDDIEVAKSAYDDRAKTSAKSTGNDSEIATASNSSDEEDVDSKAKFNR